MIKPYFTGDFMLQRNVEDRRLLPPSTIARICSIDKQWLIEQADKGVIPCVKSGARYAFHLPTVQDVLLNIAKGGNNE